jgi:hypothetical protein
MEYAIISGIEYKKVGLDWYVLNDNVGTFTDLKTHEVMDMAFYTPNATWR